MIQFLLAKKVLGGGNKPAPAPVVPVNSNVRGTAQGEIGAMPRPPGTSLFLPMTQEQIQQMKIQEDQQNSLKKWRVQNPYAFHMSIFSKAAQTQGAYKGSGPSSGGLY